MNQRTERMSAEIQSVLGGILIRGEIRDSRVRDAGLVTITRVRVTGDLSEARVAFTVFGANDAALEQVRRGLQAARNYLQGELGRQLRTRKTALLTFEVDRGLDNAFRVDSLLREATAAAPAAAATPVEPEAGDDADQDDQDHDSQGREDATKT
jgi:ribosome-binding factor A